MSTIAKTMTAIAVTAIGAIAANSKTILDGVHRGEGVVDFKRLGRNLETVAKSIRNDVDEAEERASSDATSAPAAAPVAEATVTEVRSRPRRSGATSTAGAGKAGKASQRKPRGGKTGADANAPKPATRRSRSKRDQAAASSDPTT